MATYEIVTEGGTYQIETEDAPQPRQKEGATPWEVAAGGIATLGQGLTSGWIDELGAAPNALVDYAGNKIFGDGELGLGQAFDTRKEQSKMLRESFRQESPLAAGGLELMGAIKNPLSLLGITKNAGRAQQVLEAARAGAIQGGVYGLGEDQNRLENAVEGAGWGAALGGGLEGLVGTAVPYVKDAGARLQRAALGITKSHLKKAAKSAPTGAPNPLIEGFENLRQEGVFAGSKSPEAIRDRLAARAQKINNSLDPLLEGASKGSSPASPTFQTAREFVEGKYVSGTNGKPGKMVGGIKGKPAQDAQQILKEEIEGLQQTLDAGGTVEDWQAAKRSLQGQTSYGTDNAQLRNEVRSRVASDIRQHIEDVADRTIPAQAGQVKDLNKKLSEGLRMDEVQAQGELGDLASDPESKLRQVMRTSGGYGTAIKIGAGAALGGGGEYGRSGSIPNALAAAAGGAALMSRGGRYGMGAALRRMPESIPEVVTRAGVPLIVKNLARSNAIESQAEIPATPLDYFRGGQKGVEKYRAQNGQNLDPLYAEATKIFKDYAASNGIVDPIKAKKWVENNRSALDALPELKAQLVNSSVAQSLVSKHFADTEPVSIGQAQKNALKEFAQIEPEQLLSGVLSSANPKSDMQQILGYLKQDKDAVNGLKRVAVDNVKVDPSFYGKNRQLFEQSGLFTTSQIKVADSLYGGVTEEGSTLAAIKNITTGGFLSSSSYGKFVEHLEPILRQLPPEVIQGKIEEALFDPLLARDLLTKANPGNVSRGLESIFKDVLPKPAAPVESPKPPPIPKQQSVTSKQTFPNPQDLQSPPTSGSLRRMSLSPETQARIAVESSGNPDAVSPKGAQGLSQIMPATGQEIGQELGEPYMPITPGMPEDLRQASIDQNIRFGDHYYKKQLKKYKNETLARAAYNAGPGAVDNAIAMAGSSRDVNKVIANLPKETREYVKKIARQFA